MDIHLEMLFVWIKFLKIVQIVIEVDAVSGGYVGVAKFPQSHDLFDAIVIEHALNGTIAFHLLQGYHFCFLPFLLLFL